MSLSLLVNERSFRASLFLLTVNNNDFCASQRNAEQANETSQQKPTHELSTLTHEQFTEQESSNVLRLQCCRLKKARTLLSNGARDSTSGSICEAGVGTMSGIDDNGKKSGAVNTVANTSRVWRRLQVIHHVAWCGGAGRGRGAWGQFSTASKTQRTGLELNMYVSAARAL